MRSLVFTFVLLSATALSVPPVFAAATATPLTQTTTAQTTTAQATSPPPAQTEIDANGDLDFMVQGQSSLRIAPVTALTAANGCNASTAGAILFNTATNQFEGCNGTNWVIFGGNAPTQTWTDVTSARAINTVYQNTETVPINVLINAGLGNAAFYMYVGATNPPTAIGGYGHSSTADLGGGPLTAVVPPGDFYEFVSASGNAKVHGWYELQ
jgi:hypothetical protein